MHQKVFVNRILNMKKIKFIGLDMDHTLIRYKTKNFEALVYKLVVEHLIENKNYPQAIRTFKFNFDDAIRGLVVDSKNGNILKLSRYGAIRQSEHGTKPIQYDEQKQFYRSIYVDLSDPNYMAIDTSFSIAFCVLYGQLIDFKDEHPHELPSYNVIALDVLASVDAVHAEGTLKHRICQEPEKFIHREQNVVDGLKRYIRHGKKIFILTNSEYHYANLLLEYAINPYMEKGQSWHDLFEYVITLANKPRFFYDEYRFLFVNPENGSMTNVTGQIKPGVYQGGHARKFTEDLALNGDEILYIGDHIYGDILRLKKDCNWRTALVVEELGQEISAQKKARPVEMKIIAAMSIKRKLEQKYIELHTKSIEEHATHYNEKLHTLQTQLITVDKEITQLLHEQQAFYNRKWERVFRAGAEESYFAYQVDRYACIYMEKLSDLLDHSPLTYFRANRRLLAHDMDNLSV
ncbi:HAD-IG family 5'-nucleotidase [Legionella oakridgensis]|uniref:HAD superfamily subfamily IG hydrolase, 5''-nucleotidase n=2 Tax=Legionella oakridgensis TaxID=29423 RepID=W0BDT0_9GAMM|nr:HAD-IG family 5'-nucleotidase [Legionella oakridgensis]AHE68030.1 HAD superfamily subfamily IG hydrolase, 5''-nucleotidase [Legionella oakridgensis ATCC 33761 = DSM 21215]ETO92459.1 HAD superfamily (subfamily IG) hydrolase, 5''-nucleotidase [Legionella oakridgensis RV-2-2007]KTD44569.1 cytosolic IMP-GMP specific 5'-nucleotidase [Legionella oakridgensis]STY21020.1 cytosolic IMP-GMP specific 5'-nucleotidase [Legionella longbeachae]